MAKAFHLDPPDRVIPVGDALLDRAIRVLLESGSDRAEKLQKIFSLPYDRDWKTTLGVNGAR